jgi:hypothetical protein
LRVRNGVNVRRGGLVIAILGVAAAAVAYFLTGQDDSPGSAVVDTVPAEVRPAITARAMTVQQLKTEAASQARPLYWAGPRVGVTYELSRVADGRSYVRYLTADAPVGDPSAAFLAVATYPLVGGFETVSVEAAKPGNTRIDLPAGGIAVAAPERPLSVYFSYPGADYQVEVYSPDPAAAVALVRSGRIKPIGGGTPVATGAARGLNRASLRALARREGPVYWAGPRAKTTYEVTRIAGGRTFVRYLTPSAPIGDPEPLYLTVATYPERDALAQIEAAAAKEGNVKLELEGGGLAVYDPARPTSVFVAFPATDYQIEVYSPKKGEARALVRQGRVIPVG